MSFRTGKFTARNSFYLRISSSTVLQLLLLLDDRHVEWMSPEILEKVLNVLRTHISRKLGAESMNLSKKRREADSEKVDVFRGAGWQMAYYFRKQAHRHAVLLKNKQITFEPFSKENPRPAPPLNEPRRKRKRKSINIPDDDDDDEEEQQPYDIDDVPQVKEEEDESGDLNQAPLFRPDFDDEEEDEKPEGKPKLRVSYDGFSIFGKLLVVIVEPYPPLRGQARASVRPDERELSVAPSIRGTREESEFAVPQAPQTTSRAGSRQRSESALPLRNANNPLFRPETPVDGDEEEDLDGFRARSQSILGYNPSLDERDDGQGQEP